MLFERRECRFLGRKRVKTTIWSYLFHEALGRKFRIGHVNAVGVKQPVSHMLAFTKSRLRQFSGIRDAGCLDLDRSLTDFSFVPVVAEHILHKPSDVTCHVMFLPEYDCP
jgi:hypothetical protein